MLTNKTRYKTIVMVVVITCFYSWKQYLQNKVLLGGRVPMLLENASGTYIATIFIQLSVEEKRGRD